VCRTLDVCTSRHREQRAISTTTHALSMCARLQACARSLVPILATTAIHARSTRVQRCVSHSPALSLSLDAWSIVARDTDDGLDWMNGSRLVACMQTHRHASDRTSNEIRCRVRVSATSTKQAKDVQFLPTVSNACASFPTRDLSFGSCLSLSLCVCLSSLLQRPRAHQC